MGCFSTTGIHYGCTALGSSLQLEGNALPSWCICRMQERVIQTHQTLQPSEPQVQYCTVPLCPSFFLPFHISTEQVQRGCVSSPCFFLPFPVQDPVTFVHERTSPLICVAVDAAHSFLNVLCTNFRSFPNFSFRKEPDVWRKSFAFTLEFR